MMIRLLGRFEAAINGVLLCMMAIVVLLSTVELGRLIIADIMAAPPFRFEIGALLDLFAAFLLVLIGVELLETIKTYIVDKTVHVEVILAVGLVAITRKVVVLEPKQLDGLSLIGIAAIIVALAASYFLVRSVRPHATVR